jgi:excisionase family DNA binding protein
MDERLTLSVEEAGRLLGISRGLAYALVRQGEIPALRLGRRLVVPRKALQAMLDVDSREARVVEPTPIPSRSTSPRPHPGRPTADGTLPFAN